MDNDADDADDDSPPENWPIGRGHCARCDTWGAVFVHPTDGRGRAVCWDCRAELRGEPARPPACELPPRQGPQLKVVDTPGPSPDQDRDR